MKAIVDYTGFLKFSIGNLVEKLSIIASSREDSLSEVHIFVNPTKPEWKDAEKHVKSFMGYYSSKRPDVMVSLTETTNPVKDLLKCVLQLKEEPFFVVATNSLYLVSLIVNRVPVEKFLVITSQDIYDEQEVFLEAMEVNFLIVNLLTHYEDVLRRILGMTAVEVRQSRGYPPKLEVKQAIMELVPCELSEIIETIKSKLEVSESYIKMSLCHLVKRGELSVWAQNG
ncbi:MAG: hypothetical protein ACPLSN_09020, partial [Dictyoglomus turgidum]